jgi:tRNA (uracil-5-)-methyltransferase TRM9
MVFIQRLMECVSPAHGRILIYVWAIEQDELSKRSIPTAEPITVQEIPAIPPSGSPEKPQGQDVFVPWVRAEHKDSNTDDTAPNGPQIFNRYYHMFAANEILVLVHDAARSMGIAVGKPETLGDDIHVYGSGVEILHHGWERSNHYVELRRWERV